MLRVGDMVRVRDDLSLDREYGGIWAVDEMIPFSGRHVKISQVHRYAGARGGYTYRIDNCMWNWTEEMFDIIGESDPNEEIIASDLPLSYLFGGDIDV